MDKAKRLEDTSIVSDIELFTDREKHRDLFSRELQDIAVSIDNNDEGRSAIFFYGLAGIGKTFLLDYLRYQVDHLISEGSYSSAFSGKTLHSFFFDFSRYKSRDSIIQHLMKSMIDDMGFSFPLTTAAYYKLYSSEDYGWKVEKTIDKITDNIHLATVASLFKHFSHAGFVVGLYQDIKPHLHTKKTKKDQWRSYEKALTNIEDRRLLDKIKKDLEPTTYKNILMYFSNDLRRNINSLEGANRGPIVIFLDTLEFYQDMQKESGSSESISWLQELIKSVPYVMWVLSGRDKLFNYYHRSSWANCKINQISVDRFEKKDVEVYLGRCGINDLDIHEKFYELSGGIPYLLKLLSERYNELRSIGKERFYEEYGKDNTDIIDRYLRYLKNKDKKAYNLLYQLSLLKDGWTDEMIEAMKNKIEYYDKSIYEIICKDSVVERSVDGTYRIQRSIREIIERQAREEMPEMVLKFTGVLKEFYTHEVLTTDDCDSSISIFRLLEICSDEEKKNLFKELIYDKMKSSPYQFINNTDRVLHLLKPLADNEKIDKVFLFDYLDLHVDREYFRSIPKAYEELTGIIDLWKSIFQEDNLRFLDKKADWVFRYRRILHIRWEDAYLIVKDWLSKREELFDKNDSKTIEGLRMLSAFCFRLKESARQTEGLNLIRECYIRSSKKYGEFDQYTQDALEGLISANIQLGRYEEAISLAESNKTRILQKNGDENTSYLSCLETLSKCYTKAGKPDEALSILEDCYARSIRLLGEYDSETRSRLNELALMYISMNRFDEFIDVQTKEYERVVNSFGASHENALQKKLDLAKYHEMAGRFDDAIAIAKECNQNSISTLDSNRNSLFERSLEIIISCYKEMRRYDEAIQMIEECYNRALEILDSEHRFIKSCQHEIEYLKMKSTEDENHSYRESKVYLSELNHQDENTD